MRVRLLWGTRWRAAAATRERERDRELDRLREQMQMDASLLRAEEIALDNRASTVVVAGGVIVAANAGLFTQQTAAFIVAAGGAVAAVLLAIASLAIGRQLEKEPVYSIRPWQMNDRGEYTASVMDEINASRRTVRRRRRVLLAAYLCTAAGIVGLAVNTVIGL